MTIPSASKEAPDYYIGSKAFKVAHAVAPEMSDVSSSIDIIDIRHDAVEVNLKEEILSSLRPEQGPKTLPTLLLYDEHGLQIFEEASLRLSGYKLCHINIF
jgi:hypothetical protein